MLNIQAVTQETSFDILSLDASSSVQIRSEYGELLDVCSLVEALSSLSASKGNIIRFNEDVTYYSNGSRGCEEGSIDGSDGCKVLNYSAMYFLIAIAEGDKDLSDLWWDQINEVQRKWAAEMLVFMEVNHEDY